MAQCNAMEGMLGNRVLSCRWSDKYTNTNVNTNKNTNANKSKIFQWFLLGSMKGVLGNRVLSCRWSDQLALRVKVLTAMVEVKHCKVKVFHDIAVASHQIPPYFANAIGQPNCSFAKLANVKMWIETKLCAARAEEDDNWHRSCCHKVTN